MRDINVPDKDWIDPLDMIRRNYHAAEKLPDTLKENKHFVECALNIRGFALRYFPKFQNDPAMREIAVRQNSEALRYLDDTARNSRTALSYPRPPRIVI